MLLVLNRGCVLAAVTWITSWKRKHSDRTVFRHWTSEPDGFRSCRSGCICVGHQKIWTFDIAPLLRSARLDLLLNYFDEYDRTGVLKNVLPWVDPDRVAQLRRVIRSGANSSPEALLGELNIHAVVRDAQNTGLNPGSIDLLVSTAVLEYIPAEVLHDIFVEFQKVASSNAVMSHYIVLSDQFATFDKSITPFNFLRYSTERWKWLRSPLIPLNRLRISDYRALHGSGRIRHRQRDQHDGSAEDLAKVPLAPEFQTYSAADLLVLFSWLTSRPSV